MRRTGLLRPIEKMMKLQRMAKYAWQSVMKVERKAPQAQYTLIRSRAEPWKRFGDQRRVKQFPMMISCE